MRIVPTVSGRKTRSPVITSGVKGTIDEKVKEILERKERICLESIDGVRGNASIEDMEEVLSTLL